ncbi:MAG: deoxyuridine 5'-triphosphate nucleotidohydrolase [Eubacteriales bacterium]|nr:deoxyuridine 5'-triphosphate nucleotidohydrolase [Eubacteriales bacterium]
MKRMAEFQKVSENISGVRHEDVILPTRATSGSAGYDFRAPFEFTLSPGDSITIPTGIRAKTEEGWVLMLFPRSGLGFKYRLTLDNTVGVIDSDYYNSENEGHIMVKLTNLGGRILSVAKGGAFCQGVFLPYGITYDDVSEERRDGGFGSTDV